MNKLLLLNLFLLALICLPMVSADDYLDIDIEITQDEIDQFETILEPVIYIYNFVKYISTLVAAMFLLYAGISYMTSGSDPKKRDTAKNIAMYVIIGLIVIWATPYIINLIL
jgi:hypothetical protein